VLDQYALNSFAGRLPINPSAGPSFHWRSSLIVSCRVPSLDQYAIDKFAESLEVVPRTLSENAGLNATDIISGLYAAHARGEHKAGINVDEGTIQDMTAKTVWDLYATK
jgi:T-complex protein 1 subunit theta